MVIADERIITGIPDESDGSDDTEIIDEYRSCSNLVKEARRRGSGQPEQRRYINNDPKADIFQNSRLPLPCVNMLGSGSTDPFKTLPNLAGGDTELLAHYCEFQSQKLSSNCGICSL